MTPVSHESACTATARVLGARIRVGSRDSSPVGVRRAVAADEQRSAIELVDTVIRDLFRGGLGLHSALPHVSGLAEERLNAAIDGLDGIIVPIRRRDVRGWNSDAVVSDCTPLMR